MTPLAQKFKAIAAQVSRLKGFSFASYLEDWGLKDLLAEATASNYDARTLAAQALWQLCISDGQFNNFEVGLQTVVQFLSEQFHQTATNHVQQYRDLLKILRGGGPLRAIEGWVTSYYP